MKLQSIIKKYLLLLFLVFSVVFLSGCWDRNEVNDLALIMAAGFDKKSDNTIELSVLLYIPKGGGNQQDMNSAGGGGYETMVRSAAGITVADAMARLQEKLPRQIFWGHTDIFLFNEKLAKEGIFEHVDFIMRHPQLRERAQIFVSKQPAKEVLSLMPPLERDLSEVLRELGEHEIGMSITTKELAQMLISDSGDCALPWIQILPPDDKNKPKRTIAYITGTAVFKKDKMIGKIDDMLTRGILWIRDEIRLAVVTVKLPQTKGYISVNLSQAHSKLVPTIENGKWKITLKSETYSDIVQNSTHLNVSDPAVVKSLERQIEQVINNRIELARKKVQKEMKADILGFADAFHRYYPKVWNKEKKRWEEIFPDVEVKYETKCKIRRQGLHS